MKDEMITRNSQGQPVARHDKNRYGVRLEILGKSVLLSAAKAEELATELIIAAKLARGEA